MSGKGYLIGIFGVLAVAAAVVDGQKTPTVGAPLTPAPATTTAATSALDAAGHSVLVWVTFAVVGLIAGVVYAILSGTLADRYPPRRWAIWCGLAGVAVSGWTVVAQFASWFNAVTGLFTMVTTVVVLDIAFGGRTINFPGRPMPQRDESWRDVIPPEVVLPERPSAGGARSSTRTIPTWSNLQRVDRDLRRGSSLIWIANEWGVEPDELARMVRDFRLAEDRWKDTLTGSATQQQFTTAPAGRDLSEEIRDTGWDAFLAATPMRLIHHAPDPGHPGADVVLYEITAGQWAGERVLQVIDASPEGGINHRVGIPVGRDHTDAGTALADTWGLDPEQYQPTRHT